MIRGIILSTLLSLSSLFAITIDTSTVKTQLSGNEYSVDGSMAGMYKYFDSTNKLWFLYMPALDYLLVHETGKATVAQGATVIPVTDFSSISVVDGSVVFGTYNGLVANVNQLSGQAYTIDGSMAGMYKYFDSTNKLWFLYMPALDYLLIHETGKSTVSAGAVVMDINLFDSITVSNGILSFDPSGDIETPPETPDLNTTTETLSSPPSIPTL